MRRKRIALVTINPGEDAGKQIMTGIYNQCQKYGYDVAVFTPMVHITHRSKSYLEGELNIYELINFDLFDGVIVTPIPMQEDRIDMLIERLVKKFEAECTIPVVSVNMEFGRFDVVYSDEQSSMEAITEHLILTHHCKNFMMLTGPDDFPISRERISGVRKVLKRHHLELPDDKIVFGDFWYNSGERLAERISQMDEKPEAVICASDHMAIGVARKLVELGVRVPEDVIVTGNGGITEAVLCSPTITTYDSDETYLGEMAMNRLFSMMEPDGEIAPVTIGGSENLCIAGSCGCGEDGEKIRSKIHKCMDASFYDENHNMEVDEIGISLSTLIESYILERFMGTDDLFDCMCEIFGSTYLLKPFRGFYLCVNDDWQDLTVVRSKGYSPKMNMVIHSTPEVLENPEPGHIFYGRSNDRFFDCKRILPTLDEDYEKPQVFYFSPIHFDDASIGYVVLQNDMDSPVRIGTVYKNYLRFLCNGLEMGRAKEYVRYLSEHDNMTNLLNRRGMERWIKHRVSRVCEDAKWFVMMIDMNNLKMINDSIGHEAGDAGINAIARAAETICRDNEICVRGGGDEFYVIGLDEYDLRDQNPRLDEFRAALAKENESLNIGVTISAAVGAVMRPLAEHPNFQEVLDEADIAMYVDKRNKKRSV